MEERTPLVSVIMPAFNAEASIAAAIESVQAQTISDFELIILDDCSTDHTCGIVERFASEDRRIRFYPGTQNIGVAAIRNKGIDLSRGAYIALLDSDDIWHPQKLEKQLDCLKANQADFCYTSYALVNEQMEKVRPDYIVPVTIDCQGLLKENVIGCSTVLATAETFKSRPFRTDFYHEDYVLWLELLKAGRKLVGCPEVLVSWCYRVNSRSYNKFKSLYNRWAIYRNIMGLSAVRSLYYLACYAVAGLQKYKT